MEAENNDLINYSNNLQSANSNSIEEKEINKEEVESYRWQTLSDIKNDIVVNPNFYTSWFKIAIEKIF